MKFSSSRILPGQSHAISPFITIVGTASTFFCICFENFFEQNSYEQRDVSLRLSRAEFDWKYIQAIVQIAPEFSIGNHLFRIAVG